MRTKEWTMENKRIKRKNSQEDQRQWESTRTGQSVGFGEIRVNNSLATEAVKLQGLRNKGEGEV